MDQNTVSPEIILPTITPTFKVGQHVGAQRWPRADGHPDGWGKPWRGRVLALDDPRAWVKSMVDAKIQNKPTRGEIRTHIAHMEKLWAQCPAVPPGRGRLFSEIVVLWDFGPHGTTIMREPAAKVRLYREDVAAWRAARAQVRAEAAMVRPLRSTARATIQRAA